MIVGKEFADWLVAKSPQSETDAKIAAFGAHLRDFQPFVDLRREVGSAGASADSILLAAEKFMERTDEAAAPLRAMIDASLRDRFFRPPAKPVSSPFHAGLLLVDHPALSILLAVARPDGLAAKKTGRKGGASITFGGQRTVFKFIKSGGAVFSFWEAPPIHFGFTADASGRCRLVERRAIDDGETIAVDGRHQTFVIEHATSDMVYLQAATPCEAAPFSVEYDSDALIFAGAASTDDARSRLQMMISLLRIMERRDAMPLFRAALRDPDFHVRWHVMRELLALDAPSAMVDLRAMAQSDPHPDVRNAARQVLDAFSDDEATHEKEPMLCPS